jgi:hypothetical protein
MRQNTPRMEKSNAVSTLSSGDYGDDYSIRDQAQIQFLWTIQRCTPAPLYSLRDDVFPNYKAALDSERAMGRTNRELHQLIDDALTLVSAPNHSETLKCWAERSAPRELRALMRAATENLLDWSKRFNLIGKRAKVSEEDTDPAFWEVACVNDWKASLWPIIAAIDTIWVWYAGPRGKVRMLAEPPEWNRPVTLKGFVGGPQALPPIQLTEVSRVGKELAWCVDMEPEKRFRDRAQKSFQRWLDAYVAEQIKAVKRSGFVRAPVKHRLEHYEWAAFYQVDRVPVVNIAKAYQENNVTTDGVRKAIKRVLQQIRLQKRPGRGRKPLN